MTGRYRKRPIVVEAARFEPEQFEALKAAGYPLRRHAMTQGLFQLWTVKSMSYCVIDPGDYIIRESDGNGFYPCAAAVFKATYEPADAVNAGTGTEPDCPEDCLACSGEACDLCGPFMEFTEKRCEHDVLERHAKPSRRVSAEARIEAFATAVEEKITGIERALARANERAAANLKALARADAALRVIYDASALPIPEFDKKHGPYESANHNYDEPGDIAARALGLPTRLERIEAKGGSK